MGKATVKESDLDKADELMEEMNEAMSQPLGQVMDDDELEAELAELEEIEADELLNEMDDAPINNKPQQNMDADYDLPSVPDSTIKPSKNEDDELAELEAMMN